MKCKMKLLVVPVLDKAVKGRSLICPLQYCLLRSSTICESLNPGPRKNEPRDQF